MTDDSNTQPTGTDGAEGGERGGFSEPAATPPGTRRRTLRLAEVFDRAAIGRVLAVAGMLVVSTLVVGFFAALLVLIGAALSPHDAAASGSPSAPTGNLPQVRVDGFPLLTLLMAVAGSILFGSVTGGASLTSSNPLAALGVAQGTAHFALYAPMLGLLLPVVLLTVWLSWTLSPVSAPARSVRLLRSGAVAVVAAVILEVIALLGASSITVSGISVGATTAGWPLLLGSVVVAFGSALAGAELAAGSSLSRSPGAFLRALRALPARLPVWAGVPLLPVVVWSVLFGVATFVALVIAAIVQGNPALGFSSPILLGTGTVLVAALGQLGAIQVDSGATIGGRTVAQSQLATVFTPGAPWLWGAVALALVATVLAAIALHRLRPAGERRPLWLLPAAAVVGWLVLPFLVATVRGGADIAVSVFSGTGQVSVAVALWTCLIAAVWAFAIEALARWVIPAWADRSAPGAARTRRLSLVGAGVVLLVGAAAVVVTTVVGGLFSPSAAAGAYLGALQRGDTAAAKAVAGSRDVADLPANAADRISAPQVGAVTVDGDAAIATVRFTVGGKQAERTLELRRSGSVAGVLPKWVVSAPLVTTVAVQTTLTDAVRIGGHALTGSTGVEQVRLLPGAYAAAGEGESAKYVAFSTSRVLAGMRGSEVVTERPTAALTDAVAAQVDSRLQECAASTDTAPDGCPFAVFAFGDTRDVHWTIDTKPTVQLSGFGTSWIATGGSATVRYQERDFFSSSYSAKSERVTIYPVSGRFTLGADGLSLADE